MTLPSQQIRWTVSDLKLFDDSNNHYEIVDGELLVTRAPHWKHQEIVGNVYAALKVWCRKTGLGRAAISPGIVFSQTDSVIPDVVWISQERLDNSLDESGHLTTSPELVVEVLSQSQRDRQRDYELKLKLYSSEGVLEYWIFDRQLLELKVYRREESLLKLSATLFTADRLISPLLPGFSCLVSQLFD
jgi:Uma2 family endonuclease